MIGDMCCERCGDEIQRPVPAMEATLLIRRAYKGAREDPITERRILCTRCTAELVEWMKGTSVTKR